MYSSSEACRKFTQATVRHNLQVQAAQRELYKKRQKHKRDEAQKRKYKQAKSHSVEIELTKRQSEGLLYVAFRPTRKEICFKR